MKRKKKDTGLMEDALMIGGASMGLGVMAGVTEKMGGSAAGLAA